MQRCDFCCAIINKTEHITLLVKTWIMNMAILCCQQHTAFPIPLARSSSLVGHGGIVFAILHGHEVKPKDHQPVTSHNKTTDNTDTLVAIICAVQLVVRSDSRRISGDKMGFQE